MKKGTGAVCLTLAAVTLGTAMFQGGAQAEERTVMNFADMGGIRNWRPGANDSLLIEGRNGKWFRASFWGPCYDLKFVSAIAFVTEPTGELDKFSSVLVDGQRCWFRSFEKTTAPAGEPQGK
jgi:hypothetical protein